MTSDPELGLADAVVVLAGTGQHRPESGLAVVPAVRRTLVELKRVLVTRCQVKPENVTIVNPADPAALGDALENAVQRASGPLIFYFVGHGLVNEDGRLHLATKRTIVGRDYTALSYDTVRRRMRNSRSPIRIVVLDCCFAGRAIDVLSPADEVAAVADIDGVSVLTSAGREELALAPTGAAHTIFSGALIKLLTDGDADGEEFVTLDGAVRYLRSAMKVSGYPTPRYARTDRVGELPVAANPRWRSNIVLPTSPTPDQRHVAQRRRGRWSVAVALVAALVGALTMYYSGLVGADTEVGDPLVIWARKGDIDARLIDLWNANHPQKKVEVVALAGRTDDAHRTLINAAASKTPADVYQLDVTETAEFAADGYIIELSGTSPDISGFLRKPLQTCKFDDRLWALPFTTDVGMLYYRSDLVKKVPSTLADITAETERVRALPAAQRAGLEAGYVGQLSDAESLTVNALEAISAAGGQGVTANNRVVIQSAKAKAGLRWLARSLGRHTTIPVVLPNSLRLDESGTAQAFGGGRTLFMRNWTVMRQQLSSPLKGGVSMTVGVARLPGPGVLGGQNLAVASTSTQPQAALELIKFLTSREVAALTFQRTSGVSTRADSYVNFETRREYPYVDDIRSSIDTAVVRPTTPNYQHFSKKFREVVLQALTKDGQVTDEQIQDLERILQG